MARANSLYLVIGALLVAVTVLGFYVYREETKPEGVSISIGQDGVKVEEE
jgi:RsiW-degrading membrane proteinase PrsW (M82 family)